MTFDPGIGSSGVQEDPTAGANAGMDMGEQGTPPSAERTFTQQQVDQFVQDRLSRAERAYERRLADAQSQWTRQQAPQTQQPSLDPQAEAVLRQWFQANYGQQLDSMREGNIKADVNIGLSQFQARHPELSDEDVNDILERAMGFGEDIVNKAPVDWLLEQSFLSHRYGSFDQKAHDEQVIADYLARKGQQAASTPRPQGSGSGVLPTQKRAKSFGEADAIFENMVNQANNE